MNKTTLHGGDEEPHVTETDDAEVYARQRAAGNDDVKWSGEGPAPDAAPDEKTGDADEPDKPTAKRHIRPSASQRDKR